MESTLRTVTLLAILAISSAVYGFTTPCVQPVNAPTAGSNFDFKTGSALMAIDQHVTIKSSELMIEKQLFWITRFGSVLFTQSGVELRYGSRDKKGFVITISWIEGTIRVAVCYPETAGCKK